VILGNHCSIGHCAELKNSILLNDAAVTHFVYVGDSIIGNRVNLAAGVKCANLRLDRKDVRIEGRETGLKKFGSIVGDDVQVGCNCVLNPGTLLGKGTICYPLRNVSGLIQPGSIIKDV
jgi:NDP-sugar pyrophosphorylase family protein